KDWTGSAYANTAKLAFVMQSNLTFTANFEDVKRPVNIITYPHVNQHITNAVIAIAGKARDNVQIAAVWYQSNLSGWYLADTMNSWTNWNVSNLPLSPGLNIVRTYAVDTSGNLSRTNTIKFPWVIKNPWTGTWASSWTVAD